MTNNNDKSLYDFLPNNLNVGKNSDFIVRSGESNNNITRKLKKSDVITVLQTIKDPELPIDIYELGLIYEIKILKNNNIKINMSLTSPACPVAGEMPNEVANKVSLIDGAGEVSVKLVWDPPWSPEKMSEDAKLALDFG